MKKLLLAAIAAVTFAAFNPAHAQEPASYTFDKVHTQIFFTVNHVGFSNSTGRFLDFDGELKFDKDKPDTSSVNVTIKTASINMDDKPWDDHLKNADFFNVEKFPEMTFKSTKVEVTGDNTANVTGDLTLLGVTKPVTLAVIHNKTDKHPFSGKMTSGFSATATLKRSEFGMVYGLPAVGDDVQIRIEVEAQQAETLNP